MFVPNQGNTVSGYAARRVARRHAVQARATGNVRNPVPAAERGVDPLSRRAPGLRHRALSFAAIGLAGIVVHGLVLLASGGIGLAFESGSPRRADANRQITVQVIDPPPAPPEPVVEPVEPEVAPVIPRPVAPPEEKVVERPPEPPPPDPIDLPETPPEATPPEATPPTPRRRVVGLSFDSAVSGGTGPSFAVGNTRMGQTAARASDPRAVERLAPQPAAAKVNRVATRVPIAGARISKPKRLSVIEPSYPERLKAQGIEADVALSIRVDTSGEVGQVEVIRRAPYSEFDNAAVDAARRQRFSPATRNGSPIAYTLKYTYRFRINES